MENTLSRRHTIDHKILENNQKSCLPFSIKKLVYHISIFYIIFHFTNWDRLTTGTSRSLVDNQVNCLKLTCCCGRRWYTSAVRCSVRPLSRRETRDKGSTLESVTRDTCVHQRMSDGILWLACRADRLWGATVRIESVSAGYLTRVWTHEPRSNCKNKITFIF